MVPSGTPVSLSWENKVEKVEKLHFASSACQSPVPFRPAAFMENYYIAAVEIGILKGKRIMDDLDRCTKRFRQSRLDNIGSLRSAGF